MNRLLVPLIGTLALGGVVSGPAPVAAVTVDGVVFDDTYFVADTVTRTVTMIADYTTNSEIRVPQGYTLDGDGHTIYVVDALGSPFTGSVVRNVYGATEFHVRDVTIDASGLTASSNPQPSATNTLHNTFGSARLVGVRFEAASGSATDVTVIGMLRPGMGGTQYGSGIVVDNCSASCATYGTNPQVSVTLDSVSVTGYQKTGINVQGDVKVTIVDSSVGPGNPLTPPNGIQIAYGASGSIIDSEIESVVSTVLYESTSILVYDANSVLVKDSVLGGGNIGLAINTLPASAGIPGRYYTVLGTTITASSPTDTAILAQLNPSDRLAYYANDFEGYSVDPILDASGSGTVAPSESDGLVVSTTAAIGSIAASWASAFTDTPDLPITGYLVELIRGGAVVESRTVAETVTSAVFVSSGTLVVRVTAYSEYGPMIVSSSSSTVVTPTPTPTPTPTATPSPTPTPTLPAAPSPTPTSTPTAVPSPSGLAATGAPVAPLGALAVIFVLLGALAVMRRAEQERRRN